MTRDEGLESLVVKCLRPEDIRGPKDKYLGQCKRNIRKVITANTGGATQGELNTNEWYDQGMILK